MRYLRTNQQGFTIMELVIAMALMSIFLVIMTDILTSTLNLQTEDESAANVSQDGRYILQRLSYDVARSSAITLPATLGDSGTSLRLTIGGVANTYTVANGNLQLTNGAGTDSLNGAGTSVSNFSVQRLGDTGGKDTARITFTVTSDASPSGGAATETYTITAGRR